MSKARENSQGIATLASVNGHSLSGMINRIINGDMRISQRGAVAASTALNTVAYGGADRFATTILGTSVSAGNLTSSALNGTTSGLGQYVAGLTATNVTVIQLQRIEANNTSDLNGKTITVSGKIYQDTGNTVNYTVSVNAATAKDNFTGVTLLGSTTLNVPSATLTPFILTLTLGASAANNGFDVEVSNTSAFTVTNKNIAIADIQLEQGSIATPFERRFIDDEIRHCQRYYEPFTIWVGGYNTAGSTVGQRLAWSAEKRTIPTVTLVARAGRTNCTIDGNYTTPATTRAALIYTAPTITGQCEVIFDGAGSAEL